ncbi:hypothetical protein CVT24_010158, partial [Panaeolus cyanescens]
MPSKPSWATRVLGYRTLPVSILVFITYTVIFIALSVTDTLEDVPKKSEWGGLDLGEAKEDLRVITAHPHPYNSHANDHVRSYLLARLQSIAANYSHVHVYDDMKSTATYSTNTFGVYFEGTNILVKIDGMDDFRANTSSVDTLTKDGNERAVLFSAHYDSVSTAPGATDDGMGVVTLLQLVKYFAERRGRRTVVFNVNNGEEDWLNGAHAFMEHPLSKLTDTFLNLEGAAAGGRPILFRATSTTPVRSLKNHALIPHPHANVISADAFARGVVKSGTDYSVYVDGGMQGLDLAFYKGRSRYHTKYDAVAYTLGGDKSLWSMMEVARGVGIGLVGRPGVDVGGVSEMESKDEEVTTKEGGKKVGDAGVYFDLFKSVLIVFPLSKLLTFNIVILIVGPVLLLFFGVCERVILRAHGDDSDSDSDSSDDDEDEAVQGVPGGYGATHNGANTSGNGSGVRKPVRSGTTGGYDISDTLPNPHPRHQGDDDDDGSSVSSDERLRRRGSRISEKWRRWGARVWVCCKFWVSLGVCVGVLAGWVWLVGIVNPFAIYSSPYLILLSALALTYLVQTYILSITFKNHTFSSHLTTHQQSKHITFNALYIFTWILLVFSTLGITKLNPSLASGYLVSIWNAGVGLACVLCALESGVEVVRRARRGEQDDDEEEYEELEGEEGRQAHHPLLRHQHQQRPARRSDDERGPLIRNDSAPLPGPSRHAYHAYDSAHVHGHSHSYVSMGSREKEGLSTVWWIPQFLVSVPIVVILFGSVGMVVLDGVNQGIVDGGGVEGVYILTSLIAVSLILPLSPFATKLWSCRPLTYLVVGLFALSTLMTFLSFPFTVEDPLKVFYQQRIELGRGVVKVMDAPSYSSTFDLSSLDSVHLSSLDSSTVDSSFDSSSRLDRTASNIPFPDPPTEAIIRSSLSGPKRYLRDRIVGVMPSAQHEIRKGGSRVKCVEDEVKKGLERCEWVVGEHMGLDVGDGEDGAQFKKKKGGWAPKQYFEAEVWRTGPSNATFRV